MRTLTEVKFLCEDLSSVFKRGPLTNKDHGTEKYGFLVEIDLLVSLLVVQYEQAEKMGECAVAEWGMEMEELMTMADGAGVFLSRAGDHDGAQFCFAMKNVYQFILDEEGSRWDKYPTLREDRSRSKFPTGGEDHVR